MMTRLVDVMQAMGLTGEVSRTGRWVRFPSEEGSAYVVEAAWGGGYYTFSDTPTKNAAELYLDPVSAIEACLPKVKATRVMDHDRHRPDLAVASHMRFG
jgi:hypothetical protein